MDFNNQRIKRDLGTRINEQIRVPKVLLIDSSGKNIEKQIHMLHSKWQEMPKWI